MTDRSDRSRNACASRSASRGSWRTMTISIDLREGEVHALLGENGAGKSTLMNVLYGLYRPDEGEILIKGTPVELGSPRASIDRGVGMVHQHFMLIPVMTVAENIVLAVEPTRSKVLIDEKAAEERVREHFGAVRARGRPARADRGHHRRSAAACRDPEGALPGRGDPGAGRADGGADASGGEGVVRDHSQPYGPGEVGDLHHAQAQRGSRDRRSDHRPSAREADRDAARARGDARRAWHG